MGENSKIEWTDHTFNPWMGCTKVSPACAHCYAERDMDLRYGKVEWGPQGTRKLTAPANWKKPLKWNRDAEAAGVRKRVFCASLADIFEDWQGDVLSHEGRTLIQWEGGWRATDASINRQARTAAGNSLATLNDVRRQLFRLIDKTPNLDWLLLTKRPENIRRMMMPWLRDRMGAGRESPDDAWKQGLPLKNVWLGTSVENQEYADKRIPELLKCRELAPVLFLSCEPLLGPVDLRHIAVEDKSLSPGDRDYPSFNIWNALTGFRGHKAGGWESGKRIDWVIAGGESGPEARPTHPDWFRLLRDRCESIGTPFHFKQHGEWLAVQEPLEHCVEISPDWQRKPERYRFLNTDGTLGTGYDGGGGEFVARVGKRAAGRLLDGVEHNGVPSQYNLAPVRGEGEPGASGP